MAARYGNVPAVHALLRAGAEASHADASGWHMPLHHITHCKSCSEAVGLRIAQLLLDAGAERMTRARSFFENRPFLMREQYQERSFLFEN